jgi:hypothetical protein
LSTIDKLLDEIVVPKLAWVRQRFDRPVIENAAAALEEKLARADIGDRIKPGQRVALAVGSRGIANLPVMVKTLVDTVRQMGAHPFIVPAMGSHGAATAAGQTDLLNALGITEAAVGTSIRSSMQVLQVGTTADGLPAYVDRLAAEADAIVMLNRIKPHSSYRGPYESGLMKMLAIGLGKQAGADTCHRLGFARMAENIPALGRIILEATNLVFGVAVLENAYHETCRIEVLPKEVIESREPELLQEAWKHVPRLHFDSLDVLIIDEIGKDISGTGFDTNLVGRYHTECSGGPDITRAATLDITDASHGNGNGLGILDFTTRRAFDKFSFEKTYPNALTSTVPGSVKVPMVLKNDRQVFQACIKTCNIRDPKDVRLARIKNTQQIERLQVSGALTAEVDAHPNLEWLGEFEQLPFDGEGNLL